MIGLSNLWVDLNGRSDQWFCYYVLYCLNIVGMDISDIDLINIERFTTRIIALADYRAQLSEYLTNKMMNVAPNLTSLIGEQVHFYQQIRSNILCIVVCCLLCVSLSVVCCVYRCLLSVVCIVVC